MNDKLIDEKKLSSEIRQIFVHWCYELIGNNFFINSTNYWYYHFNRKEVLQKVKERYSKDKAAECYLQNKEAILQNKWVLFLVSIRMNEKTLKFGNIRVNKKEFHKSKQPINLDLVNVDQIVISSKFKHSDDGFKCFIG